MKLKLLALIILFMSCDLAFAQQQWEQTSGPEGGSIGAIVASPNGNIYASTLRKIYKSDNNGESWTELTNSPTSNKPHLLARLAVNQVGDVFALIHNSYLIYSSFDYYSLYRSMDEGNTWELIFETPGGIMLPTLNINSKGVIFIGGFNLYISTDNGDNWNMQNNLGISYLEIDSEDLLVACSGTSIQVSQDNGITWIELGRTPEFVTSMAINSRNDIFIITTTWLVYRSTDGAQTWQRLQLDIYYDPFLVVNASDDVFVAYFENGIRVSHDNGDSWNVINEGLNTESVRAIAFDSQDNIYAGTIKGVYRSTDNGATWHTSFNGLNSNQVYSMHTNTKEDIFAVTNSELYRSTDKGDNWALLYQVYHDTTILSIQIFEDGDIYLIQSDNECGDCIGWDGHVFRSRDNGDTWEDIFFRRDSHIECISINDEGEIFIKTTDPDELYISSDDGMTFTMQPNAEEYYCNTITSSNGTNYKVGGTIFDGPGGSTIDKSSDGGNTWTPTLILDSPWMVYMLKSNSQDHLFTFAVNDYYSTSVTSLILRTIDEGLNWDTIFFDTVLIHDMEIDQYNHLYVATDHGIYYSINNGDEWNELNEGLEVLDVLDILVDSSGTLYAAPKNAGVWRNMRMVSTRSFDTNSDFSVYPNPSAGIISINLPSKMPANTRLEIFNIQGMLVKSIPVMNSQLTVDVSDLLPGPYLLNISGMKKGQVLIVK